MGYDGHFTPVPATGLPYIIVVEKANLFNYIHIGDEIAVYDGSTCVGSSPVLQDTGNIEVVAWEANPATGLTGYTTGHPISFKVWANINGFNSQFNAVPTFITGNGAFGTGQFAVVSYFSLPGCCHFV